MRSLIIAVLVAPLCGAAVAADTGPQVLAVAGAKLAPDPIAPRDIVAGHPEAATRALHTDPDGKYAVGVWQCEPGTFRWTFGRDEFVYVIEGEAEVRYEDGKVVRVKAGDAAYFPRGKTTWTIVKRIRKVFSVRE